jgi:hypothetical protein
MQSLHCPPTQVNLLMLILPSQKISFTPVGAKSSCRRFFFSSSGLGFGFSSDINPKMSKAEAVFSGIWEIN